MSDTQPVPASGLILDPLEIERRSIAIIDAEAGAHCYDKQQWPIVRRIIHTTADFEFTTATCFSAGAVAAGIAALRRGEKILCDTNMVLAGVNKARLAGFGSEIACHVADPEIAREARALGVTRSLLAMRRGVVDGCGIFLVGNAPTALFELLELVRTGQARPSLVVENKFGNGADEYRFRRCGGHVVERICRTFGEARRALLRAPQQSRPFRHAQDDWG